MSDKLIEHFTQKSEKSIEFLKSELGSLRTGRANPSLVENLKVSAYESEMELRNLAAITAPEASLLLVQPWDVSIIPQIEKAIITSNLGLNPNTDQGVIRINLPTLTSERREQLIKMVGEKLEEARVKIRGYRRDSMEEIRLMKDKSEISEDEQRRLEKVLQKEVERMNEQIELTGEKKKQELKEI